MISPRIPKSIASRQLTASRGAIPLRLHLGTGHGFYKTNRNALDRMLVLSRHSTTSTKVLLGSQPPLPVRTALVATTTAIATPAFPVIGFLNIGLRYFVWDSQTRYAVLGATTLVGAVGTLLSFAANDLLPLAYSYGQLFLPFAVVNGGLAGTAYLALDVSLGTATIASSPWTGAVIGSFVGMVGPYSGLYDQAFQWFYDMPDADGWFKAMLSNSFMLPITVTTGAAAGACMHPLLYYPIVGFRGVHWSRLSGPLLLAATALMINVYHGDYFNNTLFPEETYLAANEKSGLALVPRMQAKTLQVQDWGSAVGYQPEGTGKAARQSVQIKLDFAKNSATNRTDMVFASRRQAWLHYVTNGAFGRDVAITNVPSEREINQQSRQLLLGDGAVSFAMIRSNKHENSSTLREQLTQLATVLYGQPKRGAPERIAEAVQRIELASYGVALLFSQKTSKGKNDARRRKALENGIRRVVPGILLYRVEETDATKGCSVESQLEELAWDGSQDEEHTSRRWSTGLQKIVSAEQNKAKVRQFLWAISGLLVLLAVSTTQ
ncbi:succinylglutamate desuccinylase aspartoacylase [Seminavis robusta]|uniref:Succinylglutamate desuccinylase aspartoacylase n=1 Tax=Seminavis robusta TaxID=568900 RepID=A0A9N8ETD4_9STRA|nr:succinylglutamate desuccinylase aspartoacylase [Seminavis robusta]|eukprot:Sro1819_g299680.1 succinylglutamate desuccinylase aspartoacylase (550) ;mRNA; r:14410-16140